MLGWIEESLDRSRQLLERSVFARHVGSTFTVQIISLLISTATAAVIARVLGPSGKGMLALAILSSSVLGLFLSGGIGVANVYFVGQRRFDLAALSAKSVAYSAVATGLGLLIAAFAYGIGLLPKILPGIPTDLLALALLALPFNLLNSCFTALLQGLQEIYRINMVSLFQRASTFGLTVLLVVVLQWELLGAMLAFLLSLMASVAILGVLLRRRGARLWPRWNRLVLDTTLRFGLRGYVGNVMQFFNYRLDLFLVNFFVGPSGVGIYSVAVATAELLWYLPNAVAFVIFPKAANTAAGIMNRFTPRVFRWTLAFTATGAVVLAVIGLPLITLIYSATFAGAYVPMLALLPGVVLLGGGKVLTSEIAGRGYPQYNSVASGVSLILTLVLDLLLIPVLGILGAAVASTIAYSAIFFLALWFYRITVRRSMVSSAS